MPFEVSEEFIRYLMDQNQQLLDQNNQLNWNIMSLLNLMRIYQKPINK